MLAIICGTELLFYTASLSIQMLIFIEEEAHLQRE